MKKELNKRILTSIILILLAILCITVNELVFAFTVFIVSVLCFSEWNNINYYYFYKKKRKTKFFIIQITGLIYLFIFFISAISLYKFYGSIFILFIISICACSDIGGYIFGKTIGGKKLTSISPNKTIAGSFGSFIFSLLPIFLLSFFNQADFNDNLTLINFIFCLIISLSCQVGDLIISYFKRLNKVKDTGNILPGHGGILDRIDGIIFAIPTISILKITQIF